MQMAGGTALAGLAASATASAAQTRAAEAPLYKISLAEWSINRPLFNGTLQHLDFAKIAKSVGIDAIEYVNQFFKDKAKDTAFLTEMNTRAKGEGVTQVLIMCDGEGNLGDPDAAKRQAAVENHYKWVEAAKFLGCHTIRVNGYSAGTPEEQMKLVADGMRRLVDFADTAAINVVIENHGGLSSNAKWLVQTIKMVDHTRAGTLPDFGNFRISRPEPRQPGREGRELRLVRRRGRDDAAGQGRQRQAARVGLQGQQQRHRPAEDDDDRGRRRLPWTLRHRVRAGGERAGRGQEAPRTARGGPRSAGPQVEVGEREPSRRAATARKRSR